MRINHTKVVSSFWDGEAAAYANDHPEHLNSASHPSWGLWNIPESSIKLFGGRPISGKVLLDLGCGRGHDSVGFGRMGAKVLAVDISSKQLSHALPHNNVTYLNQPADRLPIAACSADFAISDHGAFDHTPAPRLLSEMRRVLNPGGQLIICTYSPLAYSCYSSEAGRISNHLCKRYPDDEVVFDGTILATQYSYSSWIRMFREYNFRVDRLEELVVPVDSPEYFSELVSSEWASQWPCDIIWSVFKIL